MRNFDTDLDREGVTKIVTGNTFAVVGVSFRPEYPDNLHELRYVLEQSQAASTEGVAVVLIRNPENEYDANAIEVHVPSVGMVGHVPRNLAARLAPMLDAGLKVIASVVAVRVHSEHEDRPGIDVKYQTPEESK